MANLGNQLYLAVEEDLATVRKAIIDIKADVSQISKEPLIFKRHLNGGDFHPVLRLTKSPLMRAAELGKRDIVEYLVSEGADIFQIDEDGRNVLHYATLNGNVELIESLAEAFKTQTKEQKTSENPMTLKAYLNSATYAGKTPLMVAAQFAHPAAVKYLLTHAEGDVSQCDKDARNCIMWLLDPAFKKSANEIKQEDLKKTMTVILEAKTATKAIFQKEFRPSDASSATPLELVVTQATKNPDLGFLEVSLIQPHMDSFALMVNKLVASVGTGEISKENVIALLNKIFRHTVGSSANENLSPIFETIIDAVAAFDVSQALFLAVSVRKIHPSIETRMQKLLAKKPNLDTDFPNPYYPQDTCTPLMMAVFLGHVGITKLLLDSKANVNGKNNKGINALMLTTSMTNPDRKPSDFVDITKLLVQYGADLRATDKYKNSIIHYLLGIFKLEVELANPLPFPKAVFEELATHLASEQRDEMLNHAVTAGIKDRIPDILKAGAICQFIPDNKQGIIKIFEKYVAPSQEIKDKLYARHCALGFLIKQIKDSAKIKTGKIQPKQKDEVASKSKPKFGSNELTINLMTSNEVKMTSNVTSPIRQDNKFHAFFVYIYEQLKLTKISKEQLAQVIVVFEHSIKSFNEGNCVQAMNFIIALGRIIQDDSKLKEDKRLNEVQGLLKLTKPELTAQYQEFVGHLSQLSDTEIKWFQQNADCGSLLEDLVVCRTGLASVTQVSPSPIKATQQRVGSMQPKGTSNGQIPPVQSSTNTNGDNAGKPKEAAVTESYVRLNNV